jgi:serine/threonine protein kinase
LNDRLTKPIPFGKYYLLDRVNVGGMAEVFRAKAFGVEGFERLVAVKRILPSIAEDTDFITMFIDEAKIAVQLNHANIAQIFDLGKVGDAYFIALEYVHGKDLRIIFDLARERGQTLPVGLVCYVMMKVCEGLDYAHNKRDATGRDLELVHRDISPQNVLLSFDGEVKLIDFGIAKAVGKASQTQAGILKGKFGYLSPEQVYGHLVDRRSDIFGAGIVLYELLTLERLFAGDSDFSTIEKVRTVEIPLPSVYNKRVIGELERIVMKALSRDVRTRYQTAMELHDELQRFLYTQGEPFTRRELSAWMRQHFPDDALLPRDAAGSFSDVESPSEHAEMASILEPAESKAVITETREAPTESGKPKNKSTIVGMPAMLPPADLPAAKGGRSVPPPPPRGDGAGSIAARSTAGAGRSVPPPPPRASVAPPGPQPAAPQPAAAIPSVAVGGPPPSGASRSVPPPPPRAGVSRMNGSSNGAAAVAPESAALDSQAPEPLTPVAANPVLDMDWDDEDLSTQIYDRPEDGYESVDTGYDDIAGLAAPVIDQAQVQTFVPKAHGVAADGVPAVQVSPRAYGPTSSEVPVAAAATARATARAGQATQPIVTHAPPPERTRSPLSAALFVAAFAVLCLGAWLFLDRTEPGVVQLTTHPADAVVLFDGKPVGSSSPFVRTGVEPGEKHLIEVKKDGYRSWSQEVQVQAGQTLQFPVTLQPEGEPTPATPTAAEPSAPTPAPVEEVAATGGFSLESTPIGAKVFLDGKALDEVTPLRVANLVPGSYEVKLELAGFRAYTTRLDVRSGVDMSLPRVQLEPERIQVRISSEPPGADAVVVRGDERRALGRTPLSVSLDNNGTPWMVEVTKDKFMAFKQTLEPSGEAELTVSATLLKDDARPASSSASSAPRRARPAAAGGGTGTLRINARPWAQVYVDGKLVGNTPQMNLTLPVGSHRISLNNPEFNLRKNLTVTIKAGEVETQIVNLQ